MRFWFCFFIVLILLGLASVPLVEGYLYRDFFYKQIAYYQEELKAYPNIRLELAEYRLGWRSSTAKLSLTVDDKQFSGSSAPITLNVDMNIQHGPYVYVDDKWQHLFAYSQSTIALPEILKPIVVLENTNKPFIEFNNAVNQSGTTEDGVISIQPMSISKNIHWGGLKANLKVQSSDHKPIAIESTIVVDDIKSSSSFIQLTIGSSINNLKFKKEADGQWSGITSVKLSKVDVSNSFAKLLITYADQDSAFSSHNGKYNYDFKLLIKELQLPVEDDVFSSITDIKASTSLKDLKSPDLNKANNSEYAPFFIPTTSIMKLLTDTSSMQSQLSFKTKVGNVDITFNNKLTSPVTDISSLPDKIDSTINITVAKQLLESYLIFSLFSDSYSYHGSAKTTPTQKTDRAKQLLAKMLDQGIITEKDDNYLISLSYKNSAAVLNDKPVVISEVSGTLMTDIRDSFLACYTKKSMDESSRWTQTDINSNIDCFKMDSCFRGLGAPNSGCYKWAHSEYDNRQAWDIDNSDTGVSTATPSGDKRAYFTSLTRGTVTVCDVDSTNDFNNCAAFKMENPNSITLNQKGTKAYMARLKSGKFTICNIRNNGSLYQCTDSNINKNIIDTPFVDAKGEILLTIDKESSSYSVCSIKADNQLGDCTNHALDQSVKSPVQMQSNKSKSKLYIWNIGTGMTSCHIQQNGTLDSCKQSAMQRKASFVSDNLFAVNSTGSHIYQMAIDGGTDINTVYICPLETNQSPDVCTGIRLKNPGYAHYTGYSNVSLGDDDTSIYFTSPTSDKILSCHLIGNYVDGDNCSFAPMREYGYVSSLYVIGSAKQKSIIKSVTFAGDATKPIITVTGSGFNPQPNGSRASIDINGLNFGKALHISDSSSNPNAFSAGYNDEQNGRHDAIGLVVSKYSDTLITFTFGSDYDQYFKANTYKLNQGDKYTMYVNDATFSGTVNYPNKDTANSNNKTDTNNQTSGMKVTAEYFIVPKNHPDVERGLDNLIPGMVEPKLGPHKFPVASELGKSGRVPSGAITDLNEQGEIMWWSANSKNGVTADGTAEGFLPLRNHQMYPSGRNNDNESYRSAHYHGTFTLPKKSTVSMTLGSDDDSWVFIDGKLVADAGGVKIVKPQDYIVEDLAAGKHTLDIFYIDRHSTGAGIEFSINFSVKSAKEKEADEQNW